MTSKYRTAGAKATEKREHRKQLPQPTPEELAAIEADWDDEMLGADAEYFRIAGIDNIGNK